LSTRWPNPLGWTISFTGGTVINGIAPVIGAPCNNDSGEEGKWESVELVSATAFPIRTQ